jgi:hypothetical protein
MNRLFAVILHRGPAYRQEWEAHRTFMNALEGTSNAEEIMNRWSEDPWADEPPGAVGFEARGACGAGWQPAADW